MHIRSFHSYRKFIVVSTCIKFRKNFSNTWFFFKVIIPTMFREDMFTTAMLILIRFAFTRCYRANEESIMWQQFQSFGFSGSPNSIFPCRFRQNSLRHILFIKLKKYMFQNKCLFWKWHNHCLYNLQKMQREHFYDCQITTRVFHHNRVCKL